MSESPNKRRRVSTHTYSTGDSHAGQDETAAKQPTTPTRRASYLSPTKASLARSHPNVLAKSPKRGSMTEPRGKLLRQELLGSRTSISGADFDIQPTTAPTTNGQDELPGGPEEQSGRDGFAEAIAQTFQTSTTNREVERIPVQANMRSPLRSRQPPNTIAGERIYSSKSQYPVPQPIPVPKLVKRQETSTRQRSEAGNEPDLPPTPIQLGLGTVPERPRGLASSSSIGSRSGSGRHRRRIRKEGGGAVTSSPLKPKDRAPLSPVDFSDVEDIEEQLVAEALESDVEEPGLPTQGRSHPGFEQENQDDLSIDIKTKQSDLAGLQAELANLKANLTHLEVLADRLQQSTELEIDSTTLDLLNLDSTVDDPDAQSPTSHPLLIQNPITYLNLFAPANLQLTHQTTTKNEGKRLRTIHTLLLQGPAPYLGHSTDLSFNVEIDTEDSRIDRVAVAYAYDLPKSNNLHRWIESRLQDPLHKLDVGGLIWGAGYYFEACMSRAKTFQYLDRVYNKGEPTDTVSSLESDGGHKNVIDLSRYLHETQLSVIGTGAKPRRLLLVYEIELTWTGKVKTQIDISLTGMNAKGQRDAKDVFAKIMSSKGTIEAFRSVSLLVNGAAASDSIPSGKQSSRPPKKR